MPNLITKINFANIKILFFTARRKFMDNNKTFSSKFIGKKDGMLRAMFYNIYGYMWYPDKENAPHLSSGPISLRQQMETELISAYAPDVIGMQEYSEHYHKGMTPLMLDIGYAEVDVSHTKARNDGTKINYTPLFYRPDTLNLIDGGFVMYPKTMPDPNNEGEVLNINDVSSKSLTWAVFEDKASGKRFIAICTHFMYSASYLTNELRHEVRVQNANNLLKTVAKLRENPEYRLLPVIMGGDLNCTKDSIEFKTLTDGGMEWLWDISPVRDTSRGLKQYATYDETIGKYVKYEMPSEEPEESIDHIFCMQPENGKKAEIHNYVTVTDRLALLSSDHCPRFTDFSLL